MASRDSEIFTGLPKRLQNMLADLISEVGLSSWKISGEKESTTVVLRFSNKPPSCPVNYTSSFRRKPPSQIHRDNQRTKYFQQQDFNKRNGYFDVSESDFIFDRNFGFDGQKEREVDRQKEREEFIETRNYRSTLQENGPTLQAKKGDTFSKTTVCSTLSDKSTVVGLHSPADTSMTECCDAAQQCDDATEEPVVFTKEDIEERIGSFNLDKNRMHEKLKELTENGFNNILDISRNTRFHKVVHEISATGTYQYLQCKTDELTLQYSLDKNKIDYWYLNYNIQEHFKGHNPLIGPDVCLHRNDPVSYFEYVDERRFLNSALKFIMSEIRSCAKNMKEKEHY